MHTRFNSATDKEVENKKMNPDDIKFMKEAIEWSNRCHPGLTPKKWTS
jgi:hypothetical protein